MKNKPINDIAQESYLNMRQGISHMESYTLTNPDELIGYMWLRPYETLLKYDIFVDDGGSYIRENHPLLIFVRNGIGRECGVFIPISVSNDPKILDTHMVIDISVEDLYEIKQFIIDNQKILFEFSNGKIMPDDFVGNLRHSIENGEPNEEIFKSDGGYDCRTT